MLLEKINGGMVRNCLCYVMDVANFCLEDWKFCSGCGIDPPSDSGEVRGHACHAEHDKKFSKITFFSITRNCFFCAKTQFLATQQVQKYKD